jgi:hypothetical protein
VTTYEAESWTLHKDIAKWLAAIERKVLRRMLVGIEVNENWRKRYNMELMQLFGDLDLDILSFVRISRLNWIGHVNGMDSKIKVTQVLNSNSQGRRLRGQKKRIVELCTDRY